MGVVHESCGPWFTCIAWLMHSLAESGQQLHLSLDSYCDAELAWIGTHKCHNQVVTALAH
jgi:hypothetical protein